MVRVEIGGANDGVDAVEEPNCTVIVVGAVNVCAATVMPGIVVAANIEPEFVVAGIPVAFIVVPGIVVGPKIVVTTVPNAFAGIALPTPELVH